jgi:uncharacterized damage-inducible protein DinB
MSRLQFACCLMLALVCAAVVSPEKPTAAQTIPPELGQGWLPEFTLTTRQLLQLAEKTPEEKFAWRPAPGVRSISEVYVHLAVGNYVLLQRAGVTPPIDLATAVPKDPEKTITKKADVIQWLRNSLDAVSKGYQSADRQKKVQFFGRDAVADGVFLRILVHNNEHMGQSIAYARMNGIAPPWSQ